jgi:hypothetical protein
LLSWVATASVYALVDGSSSIIDASISTNVVATSSTNHAIVGSSSIIDASISTNVVATSSTNDAIVGTSSNHASVAIINFDSSIKSDES